MATKEAEVASTEHPTYTHADGTNGHDLGRQISVTLTPQQFEGTSFPLAAALSPPSY